MAWMLLPFRRRLLWSQVRHRGTCLVLQIPCEEELDRDGAVAATVLGFALEMAAVDCSPALLWR